MPKSVSGRDLCRVLESKGWTLARITGSHPIYAKPGSKVRISVPVHGNRTLKVGLLRAIMKLASITDDEL